jgi:hypothetical protein
VADIILSFRNTAGFVTDAAGTYVLGTDSYPTTRGGFTFGWTAGINTVDRDSADRDNTVADKRLAGINYAVVTGTDAKFRVDLPSTGNYVVRVAIGDTGFDQSGQHQIFEIFDNTSSKLVIDKATGPALDHYYDATGVDRTEAAWPGSNAPSASLSFASTVFILQVGNFVGGSGVCVIAHLQITTAGGGTTPKTFTATDSLAGGELL